MSTRITPTAALLQKLVRIPSVNPADNPGVPNPGEEACAQYIHTYLKQSGARATLKYVLPGRPNVIGVFPSTPKPKRRILIAPHTDTVSVLGMSIPPFSGQIDQGKLWGRGASDTKGPMAAMLCGLREWYASHGKNKPEIALTFAGLMGEEAGNQGALALAQQSKPFDLAIIGEPTDLKIVHANNGVLWITLETQGKARHASINRMEENAILKMLPALRFWEALQLKVKKGTASGIRSVCLSTIQAGSKTNISPSDCRVQVDIRTAPEAKLSEISQHLQSELKKIAPQVVFKIQSSAQPLNTSPSNPLIQKILPATKGLAQAPWFCDAGIFSQYGTPSISFGPGSITQAHTKDEWIRLKELEEGKKRFIQILKLLET
jgi:acetylornithine deacetylase/succinyl-diaminopimelate desuccinylase-like protein